MLTPFGHVVPFFTVPSSIIFNEKVGLQDLRVFVVINQVTDFRGGIVSNEYIQAVVGCESSELVENSLANLCRLGYIQIGYLEDGRRFLVVDPSHERKNLHVYRDIENRLK